MELVAIILVIAAVAAAEVLIFGKYALKGIYYSASVNKAEVYEGETLELTEVVENRRFVALPWIKTELSASRWLAFSRGRIPPHRQAAATIPLFRAFFR